MLPLISELQNERGRLSDSHNHLRGQLTNAQRDRFLPLEDEQDCL